MAKDTTDRARVHIPWAGKLVPMERVEDTITYLWRMSADNVRTSQNLHVRTSVLNFVICAPDIATAQQASAILRDLSSTHIARVVLLILDPSEDAPSTVTTWVTLRSFPIISDIMRHSFEQVTVLASGAAIRSAATIIQPLLKPDLPVYLWWLHDPTDNEAFRRLANSSNRVIIDSNSFSSPEQGVSILYRFLQTEPNCAISDLNWGRITAWRQLVAQFFDVPEFKIYLPGIHTIEIEHAVSSPEQSLGEASEISLNPTRALFLAAWLKESLNWHVANVTDHNPATGHYTWLTMRTTGPLPILADSSDKTGKLGRSGQGNIFIRPRTQSAVQPGSICLIRLTSTVDNQRAIFTIDREGDADHVLTQVELSNGTSATPPQRTVSVSATHPINELLHEELEILGRDHLYEETLRQMSELLTG